MTSLQGRSCRPQLGKDALSAEHVRRWLAEIPGWELNDRGDSIHRRFDFRNYHETIAFVNALAYIAHREDHHPDLEVGYNRCVVRFSTHSVGGLSENDFICAAKVNALYA